MGKQVTDIESPGTKATARNAPVSTTPKPVSEPSSERLRGHCPNPSHWGLAPTTVCVKEVRAPFFDIEWRSTGES